MCGRYTLRKGLTQVVAKNGSYALSQTDVDCLAQSARYNIAPTQTTPVLRKRYDASYELEVCQMRWGLIPSWAKTARTLSPMINARSETVAEKPAYRAAYQRRRCLIPADGFYEWRKSRGQNLPFFFSMKDDSVFLMAGIWEAWISEGGETIDSYTILTTHANALLAKYHDRMPVILDPERIELWLESDVARLGLEERNHLFAPLDASLMSCQAANPMVNNNRSEGPDCLAAPAAAPKSQLDLGI
ncbi:SOS response-associated peptidase [Pelagicoccus sp. SDUM812003]|uniref:SOS response-associated peptidase n=1 Tax=Pelagicoccus sp. SDUM812003 TaxID=3041267 RepID=UPI00280CE1FE|nr:SOS response-associated peptidase [Pelagicoccus sp. SDUM812003]MDQ8201681.1 SOS response-associated peptidase [Pelagicoccus sp. SDUM812003]